MTNIGSGTYEVTFPHYRQLPRGNISYICMMISCILLQVVANYFGGNGSFQLLPGISADRFTLKGRHESPPEIPDKSCKTLLQTTFKFLTAYNSFTVNKRVMFNPTLHFGTGGLGVSALTGVIVGAVLGAVMLITFYFIR